ncbi:MAG: hypothetical protein Q9M92_00915 [Enterobacterales bacterium]|nr:hypothetical protein [Enterobacterales bacterium]
MIRLDDQSYFDRPDIDFDNELGIVFLKFENEVTLDSLNYSFIELINHPDFKHNMNACYDYSNAIIETAIRDVERHAQYVAKYLDKRGSSYRLALISDETLNSALLNVYRLLISKTEVEAEVFTSKPMAIRWLQEG